MAKAKRKVFYSFHYADDAWRAAQVRNMGVIEGNAPCSDNDWETITRGGDARIKQWIADQFYGKSCAVILTGSNTSGRKWINYEICEAWKERKGVVGIRIHGLKDLTQRTSLAGNSPFDGFTLGESKIPLSSIVKLYDPTNYFDSKATYANIKQQIGGWVEEAIGIRNRY